MERGHKLAMKWLEEFKIAVSNGDVASLEKLIENFPQEFENLEQLSEAATLTEGAIEIIKSKVDKLSVEMKKLKDARNYMQ